jgi:hypothetical protein
MRIRALLGTISLDKVWYAAYGSNLCPHRLNWYLHGGKAPTSSHWYTPSPDQTAIQARFSGQLPFRPFFARRSLIWGGSKAFIDETRFTCLGVDRSHGRRHIVRRFVALTFVVDHEAPVVEGQPAPKRLVMGEAYRGRLGHNADRVDGPNWSALPGDPGRVAYVDRGCAGAGVALGGHLRERLGRRQPTCCPSPRP